MINYRNHPALSASIIILLSGMALSGCKTISKPTDFRPDAPLLDDTNASYQRRASNQFPVNPVLYFAQVERARELIAAGNCADALPLLEQATDTYRDDGNIWSLFGKCLSEAKDWPRAITAFERALELGFAPDDVLLDVNPNDMMIKIAGFHAQSRNREAALVWLERGLKARYDERPSLATSPELANLVYDEEFSRLAGLAPTGNFTRDEQWRYDISFLWNQISMLHRSPGHHKSAAELKRMLEQLSAAVPTLSDEQITARIDLFIGALGAGHDLFWPVEARRGALLPFALKLYFFDDGLYIIDAYDPKLIGARIDAFGNTPTAIAEQIVVEAFPGDNDMEARWMAVRHLTQAYTLAALGIIDDAETANLRITGTNGMQYVITPERRAFTPSSPALKAPPDMAAPLYLQRMEEVWWTQKLIPLNSLYVQVNAIADQDNETFAQFAERVSREAAVPDIHNIILDLRHSAGGNGYLTAPLLRALIHFDASSEQHRLYVIIGRNTFSASHNLITDLDRIAQPIFVGEPSGSRPNAISEAERFTPPFSRLSGILSSQLHQHSWPEDHRIWITPDVPVGLSVHEFFNGIDPALDAIQGLITNHHTHYQ